MLETKLIILVVCGLASHILLDLIKIKREGKITNLKKYFKDQPYQTALSVIGCIAGYIVLESLNELTLGTAYALGAGSNVVAEKLGQKNLDKVV